MFTIRHNKNKGYLLTRYIGSWELGYYKQLGRWYKKLGNLKRRYPQLNYEAIRVINE